MKKKKIFFNLIITMSIAGFWHGASLNFVLWGFLNGLLLYVEKKISKYFRLKNSIKIFITIFIVFNLWVVFRINDLNFIFYFYKNLYSSFFTSLNPENILLIIFVYFIILSQKIDNFDYIQKLSKKINFLILIPILIVILITGLAIKAGSSEKFIYFDF